jgi:predicted amidohydrolase YtcJ
MLRVRGVKFFYDGALGSRGALLLADYSDTPGHRGRGGLDIGFSDTLALRAMQRGFQVVIHAIGDAANRRTLDLFETAFSRDSTLRAGRHRIEHAQILSLADIPRFARTGVTASMQPGHAVEDMAWAEARVGGERIRGGYAWRSLRRSGASLLFSSDMPGSSYDFFYMMHAAIARQNPEGQPPSGWFAEERVTAEEALRAYTVWAARAQFTESESGTIAPGRWADVTILDRDVLNGGRNPAGLLGGRALATIVGGAVVHEVGGGGRR